MFNFFPVIPALVGKYSDTCTSMQKSLSGWSTCFFR